MSRIIRTETNAIMSRAVEYHGFIYTSGLVARDPSGDVEAQTHDVLAQADTLLETHGTDRTRLLQAQIWLKRIGDREAFNRIWSAWLAEGGAAAQTPARACVEAELVHPDLLVEVMLVSTK